MQVKDGNQVETLQLLLDLDCGATENLEQWDDALSGASDLGNAESVRLLLGRGVDSNKAEPYYRSVLEAAIKKGHRTILDCLWVGQLQRLYMYGSPAVMAFRPAVKPKKEQHQIELSLVLHHVSLGTYVLSLDLTSSRETFSS
ncbi:hypothetical protein B0H14DRAFT_2602870 [Mycena olivaceomarginata]|nr:hypothetical protein B0H14DRAFT_2602870 [Mycena olivaceomarginata]